MTSPTSPDEKTPQEAQAAGAPAAAIEDLKGVLCSFVDSLVAQNPDEAMREFTNMYERARNLVQRKANMRGTKSETRDLLGEIIFSRMRRGMRDFVRAEQGVEPARAAEWVMGSMLGMSTLTEFATVLDRAILEMSAPREYSFAGMADFISIEEVLQLLAAGKHVGCLSFEKPDNRIDIYVNNGRIAFLDPHRMIRRVLPGKQAMDYREISEAAIREAERKQTEEGQPLFVGLEQEGAFRGFDVRFVMSELGVEVFHEFLTEKEAVFFSYLRLEELPDFAKEYDLKVGVTPILLEGNKRLDDWRSMAAVFPDRHEPVRPVENMYAKIGNLDLGIVEIKLLAHVNGENSPKAIADAMGLPIYETYQHLVRLAREGAIDAPGGAANLSDVSLSVEDSMKLAFEALDANDDQLAVASALDQVLGDSADGLFGEAPPEAAPPEEEGKLKVSLDFLKPKDED